uniref:flagellar basal body P-ring formation chaperone FlgA n=1 Tax=Stappia sp. TaxID=1870903 RepID=UPI003BA91D30
MTRSLLTRFVRLAGLAATLAAAVSVSASAATLRSEVRVVGPVVTIGDFFSEAGTHAATPLFRAPDLGTRGNVPASLVVERARAAGFGDATTDGLRSVSVERLAVTIGITDIEEAVRAALLERNPDLDAKALSLSLNGLRQPVMADAGSSSPLSVVDLDWNPVSGQIRTSVRIRTDETLRLVTLHGIAQETVEIFTAARPLERGAVVSEGDLQVSRIPRHRATARQITERGDIVGLAARRAVQAGRPLFKSDFEEPVLVRRGDRVTMIYRVAGMTLTTLGQAMENGSDGAMIDVLNLQSRRTITAIVRGRDQVEVGFAHRRLAQLEETIR